MSQPEYHGTVAGTAKRGILSALYMLLARYITEVVMMSLLDDHEEGAASGRATALMIGMVLVFHGMPGPQAIGAVLTGLQVVILVSSYLVGACGFWGVSNGC